MELYETKTSTVKHVKNPSSFPCNCIGPQNGNPLCPCAMRGVVIENGRYVKRIDLGPAKGNPHD